MFQDALEIHQHMISAIYRLTQKSTDSSFSTQIYKKTQTFLKFNMPSSPTQIHDPTHHPHQQLSITPLILKTHITKQTIHKFSRERREKLTTDPDRCVELEEIGLREEDLASVDAQLTDLTFWQLNLFPSFTLQQSPYYILQNSLVHHPLHRHHIHFFLLKIQFFPKSHHTHKAKSS